MASQQATPGSDASDRTVAELVKQLSEQASALARQEAELAKTEIVAKGRRAGIGAGMFGGAGALGFYAGAAIVAAVILALATALAAWLAAVIVAAVLAAGAGALALQGKRKVRQASPPIPEQATESSKEDVQWVKARARTARR